MFITFVEDAPASKKIAWANTGMIVLNILVVYLTLGRPGFNLTLAHYGFIPARGVQIGLLTGFFLHSSWAQLVTNMAFLFMFGKGAEHRIGRFNYVLAYFGIGLASELVHWYFNRGSMLPLVGASRIVTGLGVIYLLMYPWGKMKWVFSFFGAPVLEIPSRTLFVMAFWALVQLALAFFPWSVLARVFDSLTRMGITLFTVNPTAGTAWRAHLGAMAAGLILHFLMPPQKHG